MKKLFALITVTLFSIAGFAQLWTPKNLPPVNASNPTAFSIDSIAYVYTGSDTGNFYAYNPVIDNWVKMADFPGTVRKGVISFAIGSYGYIGAGETVSDTVPLTDFYQYNPSSNTWTAMASYPDTAIYSGSFAIDSLGYVAGGNFSEKCYQYNPAANRWTQKSNVPFSWYRLFATASSTKGYCAFGLLTEEFLTETDISTDIYEYDPTTDSWVSKMPMPGIFHLLSGRFPQGFLINDAIYILNSDTLSFAIFNIDSNTWTNGKLFNYPSIYVFEGDLGANYLTFSVSGLGYIYGRNNSYDIGNYFWQYNPDLNFTASYTAADSFCPGDAITFTVASNISFAASNYFKLQFAVYNFTAPEYLLSEDSVAATGPGTFTLHVPYWDYSRIVGYAAFTQITVSSTNPLTEAVFNIFKYELMAGPSAANLLSTYATCNGTQLNLSVPPGGSFAAENYYWSDTSGVFDNSMSVTLSPSSTTTYYFEQQIQQTGCAAYDTFTVTVDTLPSGYLPSATYNICPSAGISIGGSPVSGYTYSWADGRGFTSTLASPTVSPSVSDIYFLTVTDTSTGCFSHDIVSVTAKTPPAQTICLVTVDSTSSYNIVTWEKLDKYATDSFYIYRETSTNNYTQIGAVQRDSLSVFEDFSANPNLTSYRYKISTHDTCGNTGVLSPYHNTILLQYLGSGELIWNTYDIEDTTTPVATFDVLIDPLGTGVWDTLVSLPGTQSNAQDVNFASHTSAQYRVLANFSYTCVPFRSLGGYPVFSNITTQAPAAIHAVQEGSTNIYPNPATNLLYIQYSGRQPDWVTLYAVSGEKLYEAKYNSMQINVANLSAGIYFIEIRTGADSERHRFVKM